MKTNLFKFILSSFFVLCLFPVITYAETDEPTVTFEKQELKEKITQETLDYLLEQADGEDIIIHDVYEPITDLVDYNLLVPDLGVQPNAIWHSYSITSRVFSHRAPLAAQLYASVPRGQTLTLSTSFTSTNSLSIGGGIPVGAKGEITATFGTNKTKTIKKGIKLKGPGKSYKYRQYYITRFQDHGTFKLIEKNIFTGGKKTYKKSYAKPSSQDPFVNWSRDVK